MERCQVCASAEEQDLRFHDEIDHGVEVVRCGSCSYARLLPWDVLVGLLLGCGMQQAQQFSGVIRATCDFFSRSESELWAEVNSIQQSYTEEQAYASG